MGDALKKAPGISMGLDGQPSMEDRVAAADPTAKAYAQANAMNENNQQAQLKQYQDYLQSQALPQPPMTQTNLPAINQLYPKVFGGLGR